MRTFVMSVLVCFTAGVTVFAQAPLQLQLEPVEDAPITRVRVTLTNQAARPVKVLQPTQQNVVPHVLFEILTDQDTVFVETAPVDRGTLNHPDGRAFTQLRRNQAIQFEVDLTALDPTLATQEIQYIQAIYQTTYRSPRNLPDRPMQHVPPRDPRTEVWPEDVQSNTLNLDESSH